MTMTTSSSLSSLPPPPITTTTSAPEEPSIESISIPTRLIPYSHQATKHTNGLGHLQQHYPYNNNNTAAAASSRMNGDVGGVHGNSDSSDERGGVTIVELPLEDAERAFLDMLRAASVSYNNSTRAEIEQVFAAYADVAPVPTVPLPLEEKNGKPPRPEPLVFRIAGGWVRDKLLHRQTHDVDVAVSTGMTGTQAAVWVKQYLQQMQEQQQPSAAAAAKPALPLVSAGRIGVIAANPAQSKHLETATMRIRMLSTSSSSSDQAEHKGDAAAAADHPEAFLEVDFCHLRGAEVYQDDSRIPIVAVGTPFQDAMRRDFTLNALFYNVTTQCVEDWTGRGLQDLRRGVLVTPLDPVMTFRDDPLRVLRAVRFAVRYPFQLDPALQAAAQNPHIHHALHVKVSRERVGKELEAMVWSGKGADPVRALRWISDLQLAGSVFALPIVGQNKITSMSGTIAGHEYHDWDHDGAQARHVRQLGWELSKAYLDLFITAVQAHEQYVQQLSSSTTTSMTTTTTYEKRLTAMAAYLLPFRHLTYREGKRERQWLAISYIFREGIKFKNTDVNLMTRLFETLPETVSVLQRAGEVARSRALSAAASSSQPLLLNRLDAGMWLRSVKELWVTSLLLATVLQMHGGDDGESDHHLPDPPLPPSLSSSPPADELKNAVISFWLSISQQVYQAVIDLQLDGCWEMKPLLDGKALIQTLQLPQGPVVGTYREEQLRWMLLHPAGSLEDCTAHLRSFKRKLEEEQGEAVQGGQTMNGHGMAIDEMVEGKAVSHHQPPSSSAADAAVPHNGEGSTKVSMTNDQSDAAADNDACCPHSSKKMHVESMG